MSQFNNMKKLSRALSVFAGFTITFCMSAAPFSGIVSAANSQRRVQQTKPSIVARISFDPKVSGFGFQNYTNAKHRWQDDLNAGDMIRFFGAGAVCLRGNTAQNCVMKAAAREWMMQRLEAAGGGHCEGMAITSLRLATAKPFKGKANAPQFQNPAQTTFQLKLDQTIENYIAYYHVPQSLPEVYRNRELSRVKAPVAVVGDLIKGMKAGPTDPFIIAFYKYTNGKLAPGHAVTPFAVEDAGTFYRIHVYDNNYPGQTRFIIVEKAGKQNWKYITSANPSEPPSTYVGNIDTKSLATYSFAVREKGCFKAPFAVDGKGGACVPVKEPPVRPARPVQPRKPIVDIKPIRPTKPAQPRPPVREDVFYEDEMAEFALNGQADMLVIDADGYAIGYDPTIDRFVDEIPYSEMDSQMGGRGYDSPLYRLPFQYDGAPYTILISGKYNQRETNVDFTYSGPGFTIGFDGILVDPNELIAVTVSPNGEVLSFTSSNDGETPEIYFDVDYGDRSTRFELDGGKLKPGKTLTVNYNYQTNIFNFYDNDGDNDDYDVDYTLYNLDGTIWYYETDNVNFGTNDNYQMDFSKWAGTGAVGVAVDEEDDGFEGEEYIPQEIENNDDDPDDADDEGDDEDSDADNDGTLNDDDLDDDNDGTPDSKDSDDDNDGLSDSEDQDTDDDDGDGKEDDEDTDDDNDGTPDDKDTDDDNDGVSDDDEDGEYNEPGEEDEIVNDADDDNDGIPDAKDPDDDNDGMSDSEDEDTDDDDGDGKSDDEDPDDDNDGTPDDKDTDDDNDGESDEAEAEGDGEYDNDDADGDGTPNDKDTDDDNDGEPDATDNDDDNDGESDGEDEDTTDDDGDGTPDDQDTDDDNDGTPDDKDTDDDNDGESDEDEEKGDEDFDNDGNPDDSDTDDDNDGTPDDKDTDDDNDGTPDDKDTDDDNDGVPDSDEGDDDVDNDGISNDEDTDDDGDGIPDETDTDDDGDGIPDDKDPDDDNDGEPDSEEEDPDGESGDTNTVSFFSRFFM